MPEVNIILGPPGTGKTENLLRIVDRELKNGTDPSAIAFVSFTTKATDEARNRAKIKFNLTDDDLPYFSTLHAFGKRQLGMTHSEVMDAYDYKTFAEDYGVDLNFVSQDWDDTGIITTDNKFLRIINKARVKKMEVQEFYNKFNLDVAWPELSRAYRSLEDYKEKNYKHDFTDMLSTYIESGPVPKLDVVIIDEAQDLNNLQWEMAEKMWANAKRVYISGDDDQAIFRWAGADVEHLINMKGNVEVLKQSYRCPQSVHKIAADIANRIHNRREKEWHPRDYKGVLKFHAYPEAVNVREGNWLILATCKYMFKEIENDLRIQGLPYKKNNKMAVRKELLNAVDAWNRLHEAKDVSYKDVSDIYGHLTSQTGVARGYKNLKSFEGQNKEEQSYNIEDLVEHHGLLKTSVPWDVAFEKIGDRDKEYLQALERFNPENLTADPLINLSTIHVAKGGECDNVMLFTDISRANRDEMEKDSDDTNRVFYVGITRAKKELHIIQPQQERGFII
jgi:superfamily I DNA/RNA helicase